MRDLVWASEAWEDYLWWQTQDRKTLKRINALLRDIARNGQDAGIGKAEPWKGRYLGWWSRRIDAANRLVYRVRDDRVEIISCRTHYGDRYLANGRAPGGGAQPPGDTNRLDSAAAQYDTLAAYLEALSEKTDRWVCDYREG